MTDLTPQHMPRSAQKMGMMAAVRSVLQKYVTFSGRARRAEFWWFSLFIAIAGSAIGLVERPISAPDSKFGEGPLSLVFTLAILIPSLAVASRRLHDIGRSGWWQAAPFVPALVISASFAVLDDIPVALAAMCALAAIPLTILLLVWWVRPSQPGTNRFGPSPVELNQ